MMVRVLSTQLLMLILLVAHHQSVTCDKQTNESNYTKPKTATAPFRRRDPHAKVSRKNLLKAQELRSATFSSSSHRDYHDGQSSSIGLHVIKHNKNLMGSKNMNDDIKFTAATEIVHDTNSEEASAATDGDASVQRDLGDAAFCCSWDLKYCNFDQSAAYPDWCDLTPENCRDGCGGFPISPSVSSTTCIDRFQSGCSTAADCCGASEFGADCIDFPDYRGCGLDMDNKCCSWDLKNCFADQSSSEVDWCDLSVENCEGPCGAYAITLAYTDDNCITRWTYGCNSASDCCGAAEHGADCVNFMDYTGCGLDQDNKCCSYNLKDCFYDQSADPPDWCDWSRDNCEEWCGGTFVAPADTQNCAARWDVCENDSDCCDHSDDVQATCRQFESGIGCGILDDGIDGGNPPPPPTTPAPTPPPPPTKTPTRAPTKDPTRSPTKDPTRSPTRGPTKDPTRSPTRGPTRGPTNAPTPVLPTPAPTESSGSLSTMDGRCCTWDLKFCGFAQDTAERHWCDGTVDQCEIGCEGYVIPIPTAPPTCLERWNSDCNTASDCCGATQFGADCLGFLGYFACGLDQDNKCCSYNLKDCFYDQQADPPDWCDLNRSNCEACDGTFVAPAEVQNCNARWDVCQQDSDCCTYDSATNPATCRLYEWGMGCGILDDGIGPLPQPTNPPPTDAPPTPPPSATPTTRSPTRQPTPQPTPPPSATPTTRSPTRQPTPQPTPPPVGPTENFCCSWDLKNCNSFGEGQVYCNLGKSECQDDCENFWIDPVANQACTGRYFPCETDEECCDVDEVPATCRMFSWGGPACGVRSDGIEDTNPVTSAPTLVTATPEPTPEPTPPPTAATPVATPTPPVGPFPGGPYITAAQSSERVVIPQPPQPPSDSQSGCPHFDSGLLDWDSSWSGDVTLPTNTRVIVRQSVPFVLGTVTVPSSSELIFGANPAGIDFDCAGFEVTGKLTAGSETCHINTPITITLHGSRPRNAVTNVPPPAVKGISVTGEMSLHGKRYFRTWTRLAKTVEAGENVLLLQDVVNWEPGQQILLVTTAVKDSIEWHQNEVLEIASVATTPTLGVGTAVFVNSAVQHRHVANSGYQGEVGLLTRSIKIQGDENNSEPTDPDPLTCTGMNLYGNNGRPCSSRRLTGYGGHIMIHEGGRGYVEGVELFRMGQTNLLGRYPIHFHLLGNCPSCYFRASSVHRSFYRCISIHGTNQMTASENVAYDVIGYCYYLEDGVEELNELSFNLGAHVHLMGGGQPPQAFGQTIDLYFQSDSLTLPADVTASPFYITNVNNDVIGNAASGGWAGFAFPNLPEPVGLSRGTVNIRPSSRLSANLDGNTAHSTGWWWYHSPAFYFGGSLYFDSSNRLTYNAGRDFSNGRSPCLVNQCVEAGNCDAFCYGDDQAWIQLSNSKAFLTPSVGLGSWSGRMEILGFEAHDVGLSLEALEAGFWMDNMLVVCRSGDPLALPPGAVATAIPGDGFSWYDTGQDHIMTNTIFRNCGYRSAQYTEYDNSPNRGCAGGSTGCVTGSAVMLFLTHSDQFNPELMQATRNISFENCGRRFGYNDFRGPSAPSSVSGLIQNWLDVDGSVTGFGGPSVIASGLPESDAWWMIDDAARLESHGPFRFFDLQTGPERGLGHVRMLWDQSLHNQVGSSICSNGNLFPCNPVGEIRHIGGRFSASPGLPITGQPDIAGPTGGFGWLATFNGGSPRSIRFELVELTPDTIMMMSIPYPPGTTFTVTASAAYCEFSSLLCQTEFTSASSVAEVRASAGNRYHVDSQGILTLRLVQLPHLYLGPPGTWELFDFDSPGLNGRVYALDRFERAGILLPQADQGPIRPHVQVEANCGGGVYCNQQPPDVDPDPCPSGTVQTAYDTCCSTLNPSQCIFADGSAS